MSSWVFKIDGVTQDLGVIESISTARVQQNVVFPPVAEGQSPSIIKYGPSYRTWTIQARYIDTEANIGSFIADIEIADEQAFPCTIQNRFSATEIDCFITGFTAGRITYTLQLQEGSPLS